MHKRGSQILYLQLDLKRQPLQSPRGQRSELGWSKNLGSGQNILDRQSRNEGVCVLGRGSPQRQIIRWSLRGERWGSAVYSRSRSGLNRRAEWEQAWLPPGTDWNLVNAHKQQPNKYQRSLSNLGVGHTKSESSQNERADRPKQTHGCWPGLQFIRGESVAL